MAMIAALGSAGAAWCQGMNDPTRPPSGIAAGDPDGAVAAGGPLLQSVLISPAGNAAIINGEMIRVGQKFGDAVLVKVAESEVVLRSGSGTQVLKLHPGVEKRMSAPPTAKAAPRRGKATSAPAGAAAPR
jgi:MSHA biogenesis protein MshK